MKCYDLSTMGNDAEACNVITSSNNKIGYTCAQFDGSHYVTLPASLKLIDKFTCNFWAYMEDWTQYTGMRLISSTEGGGWNIEDAGDNIRMSCYDGIAKGYKTTGFYAKSKLTPGWHMFTCQFDGTNAKLYIDAVQVAKSANYQDAPNGSVGYNSGNRIFIGCEAAGNTSPGGQYFKGRIDDFKMYASALTVEDLQKEYSVRAHIDNNCKLYTKWLNEVEVGYSKYNLVVLDPLLQLSSATQKPSPDMNFYELSAGGNPMVNYNTKVKPVANHKYYGAIVWRTLAGFTVSDNRFEWWCGDGANQNMIFAGKGNTNGNAVKLSSIQSLSTVADGTWRIRNFTVSGSTKAWTSDPILVDLTEIFGAGNEPDVEWCDKNIIFDPVNLISDSSFENTTKNESGSNGTAKIVDYAAYEGNKSLELDATQTHELTTTFNNITYWRPMHKYYWGAWIKKDSGDATTGQIYMQPETTTKEPWQGAFNYGPADGNWHYCSFITRDDCFTHNNFTTTWNQTYDKGTIRIDCDNKAKVYYDNLQQIDLTALYGWGNEPTLAECDKLFGYKNANVQFCDEKGVTNINQISEMGRPMRYIRIISTGSNKNGANHIIQACAETVDNGKIMLADAANFPDDKMKAISGLSSIYKESAPYYWNESGTTVIFDLGKIDFVASVFLKRYYPDSRYYYGTKIEGSLDKSTWFTIWDSHNTGSYGSDNQYNTYVETEQGRTFIVEPDKVYITDKGTVIVNEIEEY